jgi:excisionase family DNA binding protein
MTNRIIDLDTDALRELIADAVRDALTQEGKTTGEWLDTDGAATLLSLHRDTIARLARFGRLPAKRIGRQYRFERAVLLAFMAEGGA